MTTTAGGWPDHPGGDEISKAIVWCIERGEFGDRATSIGDDHFFTSLYSIDVPAQAIFEVPNSDLRP